MSATLSRVVRVFAFFVWTPLFYFVFFETIESRFLLYGATLRHVVNFAFGVVFVVVWFLLWRSQVRWTPARIARTIVALVVTALVAAGTGVLIKPLWLAWSHIIIAWSCWAVLWIASTAFIWQETPAERLERLRGTGVRTVPCPKCAYNMAGLHEARCPECGTQSTLDELAASAFDHASRVSHQDP
jgi:hypothetical protein